jgi:hypothetical protein
MADAAPEIAQFLCEGETLFSGRDHLVIAIAGELGADLYYNRRRYGGVA